MGVGGDVPVNPAGVIPAPSIVAYWRKAALNIGTPFITSALIPNITALNASAATVLVALTGTTLAA
jgi:hypothetical protein